MNAPDGYASFVERFGDRAAEAVWWAALAMLERAAHEAREGQWGRWRYHPRGELRRLRRDLLPALMLARLAVAIQEDENDFLHELNREARQAVEEAERQRRRAQTMEAERVRLENARRRREERER